MRRFSIWIFCLAFLPSVALADPTCKVTAKAVDENGIPIQGVNARITFTSSKPGGWGMDTHAEEGLTDKDGLLTIEGSGNPSIGISAIKDGYYMSGRGYKFTSCSLLNRWQPWNPTVEVVLKKKRNPVGMYARDTDWIKAPKLNTPIGYDLEKGDWVAPYGSGLVSDFVFTFHSQVQSLTDYLVNFDLTFSNELDGIQVYDFDKNEPSYYKWPFNAPGNGYLSEIKKHVKKIPGGLESNRIEADNYIFRVRTKTDKDGNIIAARYGKIFREFGLSPDEEKDTVIKFLYYFNPDGTSNLEFSPDKNLFPWKNRDDRQDHALKEP